MPRSNAPFYLSALNPPKWPRVTKKIICFPFPPYKPVESARKIQSSHSSRRRSTPPASARPCQRAAHPNAAVPHSPRPFHPNRQTFLSRKEIEFFIQTNHHFLSERERENTEVEKREEKGGGFASSSYL